MVRQGNKKQQVLNGLAFLSGVLAIYFELRDNTSLFTVFKPLTTIIILSLLFLAPKNGDIKLRNTVLAALIFCLMGDILLLWETYFVLGLASFLMAHIFFTTAFIRLEGFQFKGLSLFVLLAIGLGVFFWLKPDLEKLLLPVGIYILVIVFMAWQGTSLYFARNKKNYARIGIAVLLFMFSDTLIAIDKFKVPFRWSGPVILGTYWVSIGLITNAMLNGVTQNKEVIINPVFVQEQ
ncbi:lysoplasmalogenase [Muricauda sp. JGD-17]|uniref:Lysoplasmalogenase n=1 Tax=Flagellimonas ochracea TaxID=2696472 RepID=A0A964TBI7_9FLAO|nr:lysoplasmalogenase [Allomuricauda ochracea]NAY91817.1 lysoplasmalogenase [Allomuricauda ochracea]